MTITMTSIFKKLAAVLALLTFVAPAGATTEFHHTLNGGVDTGASNGGVNHLDSMTTGTFTQQIDHFGQYNGSFQQTYWIDSEYASGPDAPVIFRLCGEDSGGYFVKTDSSPYFAKMLHAHVVYLEHRYYGTSQPFADQSNEHMKYLTLDNVLEDAAYFEKTMAQQKGLTGKWIVTGGSYSGTLSAIYRLRHPELVVGSLAASAPMFTRNFPMNSGDLNGDSSVSDTALENPPNSERPWAYESCTTFGFWVYQDGGTIYQPSTNLCGRAFGLSQVLNYALYNQNYFMPFITGSAAGASNILFTSGSVDPWNQLSINAQNNQNNSITPLLIQGAGHHFDLNTPTSRDSQAVLAARAQFIALAQKWLGVR